MSLFDRWRVQLDQLHREGGYRQLTTSTGRDFCSNDYLGYGQRSWPVSSLSRSGTASRLLRGHQPIWEEIESKLASWHRAEAVLIMNSGYTANEGLLSSLLTPNDLAFSDHCNHASLIDGLRLSRAEKLLFRHNDLNHLESLLRERTLHRSAHQEWFIITESLFSMEGDLAPLHELSELAQRHRAHLIVDEAHATGCFGLHGSGLVDAVGVRDRILASVHTGGKALAVHGAYIAGSHLLKEYLINRCRQLIFTTALPPQIGAWWLEVLNVVAADTSAREDLHDKVRYFRKELSARNISVGGSSYIASIILGTDTVTAATALRLQEAGFDVRAIRPPTVPPGTARLRISIHADHEPAVLQALVNELASLVPPSP